MSVNLESIFPTYKPKSLTLEHLHYLLDQVMAGFPVSAAGLYEYHHDLDIFSYTADANLPYDAREVMRVLLRLHIHDLLTGAAVRLQVNDLTDTPFASALLVPFAVTDQITGVIVLAREAETPFEADLLGQLEPLISLIRVVLENHHLYNVLAENLTTAQSILRAAQLVAENPSPQRLVDILRETLFEPPISSCAMLLYGPQHEDSPYGPFDYLEFSGTWSRRVGSGIGTGLRLYLKDYPDLLADLERHTILTFPNVNAVRKRFDPLVRGFMRAERVRSLTLIALHSGRQKLGVLAIATDKYHTFAPAELHSYRTVCEFMTISALTKLLHQQREHMEQYRAALLDAVTDAVVMVVPGGAGGTVLTVNKRFRRMFDVNDTQPEGISLVNLLGAMQLPEDIRAELRTAWLGTPVRDRGVRRGEFHMVNADGHSIDIEWYSAPVYQDDHALGRIYIFHDATSERTAQRLRAAFLSRVSHELRTPLTSIRGFAEFILEAVGDQLPDLAREYTEIIHQSSKHLNTVFTDMIEIARADAGELKLNKADAHLPDIIIEVVARMELSYKNREQRVVMEIDDELPPINVDVDRISQVITNLLTNAIKYSPEGGLIVISTDVIESLDDLPEAAPRDVVLPAILITVKDNGKGLSEEDTVNVFMPFFRTADAKANRVEGVGLGLAVTRSIVEVHRGKIWARPNTRVKGGCFQFTIPTVRG